MNILYLHSHDTGRYIQPYGHAVPTPNLQALAESGLLFRKAFCAGSTCSPSRAALLTGQSPHACGMLGLAHRGFSLNDYSDHILHTLREQGYSSRLFGIQHITEDPAVIGYDSVAPRVDDKTTCDQAVEFLQSNPEGPFFLSVGFLNTHREFPETPIDNPNYCMPPAPLPDTPQTRRDMAKFKTSARQLDNTMGRVLDALEESGLAENTLVVCTTDHGIAFPRMKCNLTDHGIGVMLMLRGPGIPAGTICDAMVSHIDLFPTICDLLGIEPPARLEGKSMLPLIRNEATEINEEIFSEVTFHAAYEPMRAVRTTRWKYIRRYDERSAPVLPNCDDGPSKAQWLDAEWANCAPASEQLYDLMFDPSEACNLAENPAYAAVLDEMRNRLDAWMHRTNDPLLAGEIPPPPGSQVNDSNGLSPYEPPVRY